MKLSIIIPMYNSDKYLSRCIDSILNQKLNIDDYEIVIIDDGSTDKSLFIAQGYASSLRNIRIYSTENRGISAARNLGITLSLGDYVYFFDSDDYITNNSLEIAINKAYEYRLDIITFKVSRVLKPNFNVHSPNDTQVSELTIENGKNYISNYKYYKQGVWWYFIRRKYLLNLGLKFHEGRIMEDMIFTANLFLNAKAVAHVDYEVYHYVLNPNSIWTKKNKSHIKKSIDDFAFMALLYNELIKKLINNNENQNLINRLTFFRSQFVLHILKRLFKSEQKISEINKTLDLLISNKLYPLKIELTFQKIKTKNELKWWLANTVFKNKLNFFPVFILFRIIKFPLNLVRK